MFLTTRLRVKGSFAAFFLMRAATPPPEEGNRSNSDGSSPFDNMSVQACASCPNRGGVTNLRQRPFRELTSKSWFYSLTQLAAPMH